MECGICSLLSSLRSWAIEHGGKFFYFWIRICFLLLAEQPIIMKLQSKTLLMLLLCLSRRNSMSEGLGAEHLNNSLSCHSDT